eukprot:1910025-Rhodomonas_salina.2
MAKLRFLLAENLGWGVVLKYCTKVTSPSSSRTDTSMRRRPPIFGLPAASRAGHVTRLADQLQGSRAGGRSEARTGHRRPG